MATSTTTIVSAPAGADTTLSITVNCGSSGRVNVQKAYDGGWVTIHSFRPAQERVKIFEHGRLGVDIRIVPSGGAEFEHDTVIPA